MLHGHRQLHYSYENWRYLWRYCSNVEKRFDTSNHEVNRPLPTGKNKKVIGLMKDELRGKIMTEFAALWPKTYSYLMDDGNKDKKAKGTKNVQ